MSADDAAVPVRGVRGVLVDWDDDRGFGFIAPTGGGSRVFAHVSAFPRGRRPVAGCEVAYAEVRDERNRPRAGQVRYVGAEPGSRTGAQRVAPAAAATVFLALLTGLFVRDEIPLTVLSAYGVLSAVAFCLYGVDKLAAAEGRRRTPESTLHAIALLGGWPGALVARPFFRHKTIKQPFRTAFWVTVAANCLALTLVVWAPTLTLP